MQQNFTKFKIIGGIGIYVTQWVVFSILSDLDLVCGDYVVKGNSLVMKGIIAKGTLPEGHGSTGTVSTRFSYFIWCLEDW